MRLRRRISVLLTSILLIVANFVPGGAHAAPIERAGTKLPDQTVVYCPGGPASRLLVGMIARVTPGDPNRLRVRPGGVVIGRIPGGATFTVIGGPECWSSMTWWLVNYNGLIGWTAEGQGNTYWLEPAQQCGLSPRLIIGNLGRVTPGDPNRLRATPGGAVIGLIPGGGIFAVLDGPRCVNRMQWWLVNYNGLIGWTPEGAGGVYWLEPHGLCALPARLVPGMRARVTPGDPNRLRATPGGAVIGQIPGGGIFTVLSGPQCIGGMQWWLVNYYGRIGWTPEGQGNVYWLEPWW